MSTPLLRTYRDGRLRDLWQERTHALVEANPCISPNRCGAIVAAILAYAMMEEASELDSKVSPFTMTEEEEALYDWLYVGENDHCRADLQEWSGTRTMLADMPDGSYEPEWMQYIKMPKEEPC